MHATETKKHVHTYTRARAYTHTHRSPSAHCFSFEWWFRFFIKSRLRLFIFHVQFYFPFDVYLCVRFFHYYSLLIRWHFVVAGALHCSYYCRVRVSAIAAHHYFFGLFAPFAVCAPLARLLLLEQKSFVHSCKIELLFHTHRYPHTCNDFNFVIFCYSCIRRHCHSLSIACRCSLCCALNFSLNLCIYSVSLCCKFIFRLPICYACRWNGGAGGVIIGTLLDFM